MSDGMRRHEYEASRARWAAMDPLRRREAAGELRAAELHREFRLLVSFLRRRAAALRDRLLRLALRPAAGATGRHCIGRSCR